MYNLIVFYCAYLITLVDNVSNTMEYSTPITKGKWEAHFFTMITIFGRYFIIFSAYLQTLRNHSFTSNTVIVIIAATVSDLIQITEYEV